MIELCREIADKVQTSVASLVGLRREKEIDAKAEKTAMDELLNSGVPLLVVSEESGATFLSKEPEYICLLDPVDGTYNAARGIPSCAFSIAVARYADGATLGEMEAGLVRNLVTGDTYEAERGRGASMNGVPLHPSKERSLGRSTFCVYLYGTQLKELARVLPGLRRIRSLGCASLELCYVADGGFEGFIDLRGTLRNVDIAAGKLIIEEAGGRITGKDREKLNTGIDNIRTISVLAAGNSYLHDELTRLLRNKK